MNTETKFDAAMIGGFDDDMEIVSVDLSPNAKGMYYAEHRSAMSYAAAVSELVDNAFDAGANEIRILIDKDRFEIRDDGAGCPDLKEMARWWESDQTRKDRLGRYGVGFKSASISLGTQFVIDSVCNGVKSRLCLDWSNIKDWASQMGRSRTNNPSGTIITIWGGSGRQCPKLGDLRQALGMTFAPALRAGRKILLKFYGKDEFIEPVKFPDLVRSFEVEDSAVFGQNEIAFRMVFGVVAERRPFGKCFTFAHLHRTVCSNSEACDDLTPSPRFFAWVDLIGREWPLEKHKQTIVESPEREWLYSRLYEECADLLIELQEEGENVELEDLSEQIEAAFFGVGTNVGKPRRKRTGIEKGTVEPVDTPRKVHEAEVVRVNPERDVRERGSKAARRVGGFNLVYGPMPNKLVGNIESTGTSKKRLTIFLDQNHPYLIWTLNGRKEGGLDPRLGVAVAMVSSYLQIGKANFEFAFDEWLADYSRVLLNLVKNEVPEC
jgi:hypothetical protein